MADYRTEQTTENGIEYEVRVHDNGDRIWLLNGRCHRENGPAIELADGYRAWCRNDRYHREQGPAIERANGHREWYWHGTYLTQEVQEQGIDQLSPEEIRFWLPILAAQKSG